MFWLALKGIDEGKGRLIDCFKFTVGHFRKLGNPVIKKWNRLCDLSLDLLHMNNLGKRGIQRECKPCDYTLQVVEGLDCRCCQLATKMEETRSHFAWQWKSRRAWTIFAELDPRLPEIEGSALTSMMQLLQFQRLNVIRRVIVAMTWILNAVYSFRNALKAQRMRTIRLMSGRQSSDQPGNVSFHWWAGERSPCSMNEYDRRSCAGWWLTKWFPSLWTAASVPYIKYAQEIIRLTDCAFWMMEVDATSATSRTLPLVDFNTLMRSRRSVDDCSQFWCAVVNPFCCSRKNRIRASFSNVIFL